MIKLLNSKNLLVRMQLSNFFISYSTNLMLIYLLVCNSYKKKYYNMILLKVNITSNFHKEVWVLIIESQLSSDF
jgi:hypothetical protein